MNKPKAHTVKIRNTILPTNWFEKYYA